MRAERIRNNAFEIGAIIIGLVMLSPFVLVVLNMMKTSAKIVTNPIGLPDDLSQVATNFKNVITNSNFNYWNSFASSLIVTIFSLVLVTVCASMAAWVLCRNKTKWSGFIFMLLVAAMVIPFQVVMLPLLSTFRSIQDFTGIQFLQSYGGLIFAYIGFGGSMSVFILHGFVKGIPVELEEAAAIDGCSRGKTFFTVIFPLLRPVQMTILILNGIWIWNDFLLPSLMLGLNGAHKTLPVAVTSFVGSYVKQWDLILSAAFLAMIPIVILFLFAQKHIIKGMVEGSIK
ncbi:MAG: carbohydrate ABC transporter permease [Clostridiales Family XIII bacterium]|jgi:raffinose/stachyose/melibiose transport system permease protein|nr:carbohydrate ABC transporter permease [Clostridiales Family XIII bacterium]